MLATLRPLPSVFEVVEWIVVGIFFSGADLISPCFVFLFFVGVDLLYATVNIHSTNGGEWRGVVEDTGIRMGVRVSQQVSHVEDCLTTALLNKPNTPTPY